MNIKEMFNKLSDNQKKVAIVVAIFLVLLIIYRIRRAYYRNLKTSDTKEKQEPESTYNPLTMRKGNDFCIKMCGPNNKACMDECKTKQGFYGCC